MGMISTLHACVIRKLCQLHLSGRCSFSDGYEESGAIEFICGIYESDRAGKPFYFERLMNILCNVREYGLSETELPIALSRSQKIEKFKMTGPFPWFYFLLMCKSW